MREVHGHEINEVNAGIKIEADGPGPGGASHQYTLFYGDGKADGLNETFNACRLNFQNGAVNEVGVNGITHEALLTIIADRLQGFQDGPYACPENALALGMIRETLSILHERTRLRDERGVEGTMAV